MKKILPPFTDLIFLLVFGMLAFFKGQSLLGDADAGYLIRMGEEILRTHSWVKTDIFSHVTPPLPWQNHEWLSQVLMALIHRAAGLTGVVLFFSLLIAVVYTALFQILKNRSGSVYLAFFVTVLTILASELHWYVRPHVFTILFTLMWSVWLYEYQMKVKTRILIFPVSMALWVNLHGGFIVGFILAGTYIFGNAVYGFFNKEEARDAAWKKMKFIGGIFLLSLLAVQLNPHGYFALSYPIHMIENETVMKSIAEFQPPDWSSPSTVPLQIFLGVFIVFLVLAKARMTIFEILLIGVFLKMTLHSVRHVSLFAIVAAPVLMRLMQEAQPIFERFPLFQRLRERSESMDVFHGNLRSGLWPAMAVIFACVLTWTGKIHYDFDAKRNPAAAVEFLRQQNIPGKMFNLDEFGDYIIYKAWPQYRVFMYGFNDPAGEERLKDYLKVDGVQPGWREVFEKYGMDWVIYPPDTPLAQTLSESPDWTMIYKDPRAVILKKQLPT
jgi:hypothetical protein